MGFLAIGGMASSTVLTLVVVPVAYTFEEQLREAVRRGAARASGLAIAARERVVGALVRR
jgi:hypothetical protein